MALSNRDKNLIEAFTQSCRYETIKETAQFLLGEDVYHIHKYAFLIRPATEHDKATMKQGELYPYIENKPIKMVKDITRCDPAICTSTDGIELPDIRQMKDIEFLITRPGTGGSQASFLYFMQDAGEYKEVTGGVNLEGSSLTVLPMRPYAFKKETMGGNYDGCTFELRVFFPLPAPIVVITGDVVRLHCVTSTDFKNVLFKPVHVNGAYYKLDGWKVGQTSGSSTYQYFKKMKGKETMNLPKLGSPLKTTKPVMPSQNVTPPADAIPLDQAAEEPVVPPVRPLPKRRPTTPAAAHVAAAPAAPVVPKATPAPQPAGTPEDSVTVEELQQHQAEEPQVETFEQPVNAMEQPVDPAEPATAEEEQTDIPKARVTQPDREMTQAEYAAFKKRTRKPAPVVPVGFDFGPVLEYTGSALPEDLTADQIEAEIRALRDLVINAGRRMCNLTFAMRKTGNASEAKLKALADILGK